MILNVNNTKKYFIFFNTNKHLAKVGLVKNRSLKKETLLPYLKEALTLIRFNVLHSVHKTSLYFIKNNGS